MRRDAIEQETADRSERTRLALAEVDASEGRSVEDIQADLLASYRAHGLDPHGDLKGMASFLKAAKGRRGTRLVRLARLGVGGLRRLGDIEHAQSSARRNRAEDDRDIDEELDEHNDREFTKAFQAYAVYALVSVMLGVAAWKTGGVIRLLLAVLAVMLAAITAWSVLFMGGFALLIRFVRTRRHDDS